MATLLAERPSTSRRPRVEITPEGSVGTLGPLAGDIMARAGKPMDQWQQDALDILCGFRADRQWACTEYCELCPRQNGKGGILEARVLLGFLALGEKLIMWSAHEYKTALEAYLRVRDLLFALGEKVNEFLVRIPSDDGIIPIKILSTHGQEGFERLDTHARIKFIARSKGSGRGFSGDLNIIDETYAYTPEQQEALMPTILARPNPQIIYASSPPLTGETGDVLYALRERAESGDRTDALGYRDWGIGGFLDELEKININDRALRHSANPALGTRLTEARMAVVQNSMRTSRGIGFARECLGVWPRRRKGVGIIDATQWARLADPKTKRVGDVALSIDIAPDRTYAAIGLYGLNAEGLGHMQVLDYRPGTEWLIARLVELKLALDPLVIVVGRGTAASMKTSLDDIGLRKPKDVDEPHRGCLWVTTALDMSAATGRTLDVVRQAAARHKGQDELDDAVRVAKTQQTADTIAWSRRGKEGDVTPLVTVSLALWGFETVGPKVLADYNLVDSIG